MEGGGRKYLVAFLAPGAGASSLQKQRQTDTITESLHEHQQTSYTFHTNTAFSQQSLTKQMEKNPLL